MTKTFRIRKSIKYQGMAYTFFFLAVLIGSCSIFFLEEPANHGFKREHSVAIVGGLSVVLYGSMMLMSIFMWVSYYVEQFTIDGTILSIRSILRNTRFDVSDVESLKWKVYPSQGSLRFFLFASKVRLGLSGYSKEDQLQIIRALRDLVPLEVQEEWPQFCHKVALPLRDGKSSIVRNDPSSKFYTITRKRYDRMLVIGFPLSVALAIALWIWLDLWQFIALPFLAIAAWLLLRSNVPPEGHSVIRLTSTSEGRAQILGLSAVAVSNLLMVVLGLLGFGKAIACWSAIVLLLLAIPPMLYLLYKSDKQRRKTDEQAAELAPAEWQRGEGAK